MNLKYGNSANLVVAVKDKDGVLVTNLSTAVTVKFMVKVKKTDLDSNAVISKDLTSGITVDDPSAGYLTIVLSALDTSVDPRRYFIAIQINYASSSFEIYLKEDDREDTNPIDVVSVTQDIIRNA